MIASPVIIRRLQVRANKLGGQKQLAKELGISPQYLSDVMTGKSEPGPAILEALGYERVVLYKESGK